MGLFGFISVNPIVITDLIPVDPTVITSTLISDFIDDYDFYKIDGLFNKCGVMIPVEIIEKFILILNTLMQNNKTNIEEEIIERTQGVYDEIIRKKIIEEIIDDLWFGYDLKTLIITIAIYIKRYLGYKLLELTKNIIINNSYDNYSHTEETINNTTTVIFREFINRLSTLRPGGRKPNPALLAIIVSHLEKNLSETKQINIPTYIIDEFYRETVQKSLINEEIFIMIFNLAQKYLCDHPYNDKSFRMQLNGYKKSYHDEIIKIMQIMKWDFYISGEEFKKYV
jgi:hypothetical protein